MAGFGLLILAVTMVLALVLPAALGQRPVPGEEVTKPPWMFLIFYPLEDWFGIAALVWAPIVLFGLLALVPFVDRSPYRSWRRRRVFIVAGVVLVIVLVAFVVFALVTPPQPHLMQGV